MKKQIYANALLKDGKIMFWWTGYSPSFYPHDFYKDFYFSGLDMDKELSSGRYSIQVLGTGRTGEYGFSLAREWYKNFEIHPDSKGARPY